MTNEQLAAYAAGASCPHVDVMEMAEEIQKLRADISQAYDLRDKAEGRYCTALGTIEQLHAAVKMAQELAATRLMEIERLNNALRGFLPANHPAAQAHEPEGSRSAPGMGNYNYWQHMHQWGQDAEYHYYQSCQCARCRQQYDINVAEQQRILASQKS